MVATPTSGSIRRGTQPWPDASPGAAARRFRGERSKPTCATSTGSFGRASRTASAATIVTSHAAFGYLAARYGLEQIALTGVSPEAEPTPRQLEELVDEVERTGSTTVFFETLVSPRLAETVARETGAEARVLNPIEGLTPEEADRGEDYFSLMRANLATLREALGCR